MVKASLQIKDALFEQGLESQARGELTPEFEELNTAIIAISVWDEALRTAGEELFAFSHSEAPGRGPRARKQCLITSMKDIKMCADMAQGAAALFAGIVRKPDTAALPTERTALLKRVSVQLTEARKDKGEPIFEEYEPSAAGLKRPIKESKRESYESDAARLKRTREIDAALVAGLINESEEDV